ncbi:hypothetical protein FGO68_gene3732 [Halteria grandinella]|uniref:Uncharacterized protein n=1 Tax=Halteria grandinella TaxID=5974 RepID=A0A8J8P6E8_HALGN|nr:hypothetical protein FGO68_gene3732 [Halteria grandinella]
MTLIGILQTAQVARTQRKGLSRCLQTQVIACTLSHLEHIAARRQCRYFPTQQKNRVEGLPLQAGGS